MLLFLRTNDFRRDHAAMLAVGIGFVREPTVQPCGAGAVFLDLYGDRSGLVESNDRR